MFDEMRGAGIHPSPEATAALIRSLAKGGHGSSEAVRLLGDMRAAEGTSGGRGRAYRGGGGVEEAGDEDGEGGRGRGRREAQTAGFAGAIEACATFGEWQKAVSLLDEMREVRRIGVGVSAAVFWVYDCRYFRVL